MIKNLYFFHLKITHKLKFEKKKKKKTQKINYFKIKKTIKKKKKTEIINYFKIKKKL